MPDESDEASIDESITFQDEYKAPSNGFGDDFDDFEAGGEDEDFGDFDDGFEQPSAEPESPRPEVPDIPKSPFVSSNKYKPCSFGIPLHTTILSSHSVESVPCRSQFATILHCVHLPKDRDGLLTLFVIVQPPIPFEAFATLDTLLEATDSHLKALFPNTTAPSSQSPPPLTGPPPSLFLSDRSHSLFTQLIAPPPLSPPNWLRSRTRRLFLVSLGVPVDLDEILPKSKQKKLVLPSTVRSDSEHRRSGSRRRVKGGDMRGLKDNNALSTSVSSQTKDKERRKRRGGAAGDDQLAPNPPPLDLPAIHHLCSTTETALKNMTDAELQGHVRGLEETTKKAGKVLEYWVRRRDAAMGEKEMFESVVGDLVKHARRVRR